MELDFGSFLASSAFFDDDGPEFAQGADFGDFQEQVGADGDRKAHVRRSFIHGEAAFLHGAQIGTAVDSMAPTSSKAEAPESAEGSPLTPMVWKPGALATAHLVITAIWS